MFKTLASHLLCKKAIHMQDVELANPFFLQFCRRVVRYMVKLV